MPNKSSTAVLKRTEAEIAAEVLSLRNLLPKIWEGCDHARVNKAAINAEIQVLEQRMPIDVVEATYGNDSCPEYQPYIFDSALGAHSWMVGESNERSSDEWTLLLVGKSTER